MKTYHAQLPLRNHRIVSPQPPRPLDLDRKLKLWRFATAVLSGFWFCADCQDITERIEGEQGQPAHCERCGGHRITWNPPTQHPTQEVA